MLSKIAKAHKDSEFLDVQIQGKSKGEIVFAHKFVLAGLSSILHEALKDVTEEEIIILIPDIDTDIITDFVHLIYGLKSPEHVESYQDRVNILQLCHLFGMFESNFLQEEEDEELNEENFLTKGKLVEKIQGEDEVTTEEVERILNAVVTDIQRSEPTKNLPKEPKVTFDTRNVNHFILNCTECMQKFSDEKDLAFHQQIHHQKELTFFCAICRKSFSKETSLRHHKIAAHHAGTKVKLRCQKCGGHFTGRSALSRHVANCDGKTTLDCHICGKVYARKDNLVNHLARHSGLIQKVHLNIQIELKQSKTFFPCSSSRKASNFVCFPHFSITYGCEHKCSFLNPLHFFKKPDRLLKNECQCLQFDDGRR